MPLKNILVHDDSGIPVISLFQTDNIIRKTLKCNDKKKHHSRRYFVSRVVALWDTTTKKCVVNHTY